MKALESHTPICEQEHTNDPTEPEGYVAWHEWAERKGKTHRQVKCPGCGLFKVWIPRKKRPPRTIKGEEPQ